MRKLWTALFIILLVALALSIGVNIGLLLNRQPSGDQFTPTPIPSLEPTVEPQPTQTQPTQAPSTPKVTPTVTPYPDEKTTTITDHNIEITYKETSRQIREGYTRVIVLVEAQYQGDTVTLSYDKFELIVYTARGGLEVPTLYSQSDWVWPAETGTFVVGGNNQGVSFFLTYEFSTLQSSQLGSYINFAYYELEYKD